MADNRTPEQIAADTAAEEQAALAKAEEAAAKARAEAADEQVKQAEKAKTEKVKYVGAMPEGQDTIEQYGATFEFNKATSVTKEAAEKLAGNPYFVVAK